MSSSLWDPDKWNLPIWNIVGFVTEKKPCGSIVHKGSKSFLLEVVHITFAYMPNKLTVQV